MVLVAAMWTLGKAEQAESRRPAESSFQLGCLPRSLWTLYQSDTKSPSRGLYYISSFSTWKGAEGKPIDKKTVAGTCFFSQCLVKYCNSAALLGSNRWDETL
jgi:hypothetical protein